jgi:hypothetical protein
MDALLRVLDTLDRLGVPYMIGGSLASSVHGEPRATRDADVVAKVELPHAPAIVSALAGDFYADEQMIVRSIRHRSSFNLIHRSGFKVDVYVLPGRPWDQVAFGRRLAMPYPGAGDRQIYVRTAEDIVLKKLEWFRIGGEVSERQWRDVLGVLRVRRGDLDLVYLMTWARELGVEDLLTMATNEANGPTL